jgi:leader peptidase (prepilin peptidase) / N-methyltransferase
MMVGAFLGWQVVVTSFFVSVLPALVFGVVLLAVRRDNALPFGPPLAMGVMGTCLGWHLIGPPLQLILFNGLMMICLLGAGAGLLLGMAFFLRMVRR